MSRVLRQKSLSKDLCPVLAHLTSKSGQTLSSLPSHLLKYMPLKIRALILGNDYTLEMLRICWGQGSEEKSKAKGGGGRKKDKEQENRKFPLKNLREMGSFPTSPDQQASPTTYPNAPFPTPLLSGIWETCVSSFSITAKSDFLVFHVRCYF